MSNFTKRKFFTKNDQEKILNRMVSFIDKKKFLSGKTHQKRPKIGQILQKKSFYKK